MTSSAHKGAGALSEFAKWAITEGAFQGLDLDGPSVQEKAVELGLLKATFYDPEKHGDTGLAYVEPGDEWFEFAGPLSTPSVPAFAELSEDGLARGVAGAAEEKAAATPTIDISEADIAVFDSRIKACEQALQLQTASQRMRDRWIGELAALRRIRSALEGGNDD